MHTTLIHNPTAGDEDHSGDKLLELLRAHGHQPTYQSSDAENWEQALDNPGELVVVAGGDGTVDKVVTRFANRDVPLAILPLGTANNIASSLGITGSLAEIIAGWKTARSQPFDLGATQGPWGNQHFAEAVGTGAFAQLMPILSALGEQKSAAGSDEQLHHQIAALRALIDACRAASWEIELDGKKISGDYLLLQVMNISAIGPMLKLAPHADPGDGLLDVVLIEEQHREALKRYLSENLQTERPAGNFPVRRVKHVQLTWQGGTVHVDSTLWSASNEPLKDVERPQVNPPATIQISLLPRALEILVPAGA